MIDHTGVIVSDFDKSKAFYQTALAAIGYSLIHEFSAAVTGHTDVAGFGENGKADFWISRGTPNQPQMHVAFRVDERRRVDAFHAAALQAGGRDNGRPGIRAHFHADYYGAFALDPDGHNIETVCHRPSAPAQQ